MAAGQKYVLPDHAVQRSIITIKVNPASIEIIEDTRKANEVKVKVHFTDSTGRSFKYMPITDLGFYQYAAKHRATNALSNLTNYIRKQERVYMRLGLSRAWYNGTVEACWMQVNGIYTFPEFFQDIRSYK